MVMQEGNNGSHEVLHVGLIKYLFSANNFCFWTHRFTEKCESRGQFISNSTTFAESNLFNLCIFVINHRKSRLEKLLSNNIISQLDWLIHVLPTVFFGSSAVR